MAKGLGYAKQMDWIASQKAAMAELLLAWCNVSSGTANLAGLKKVSELVESEFNKLGLPVHRQALEHAKLADVHLPLKSRQFADALVIEARPDCEKRILLVGHMDTVFSSDDGAQSAELLDERIVGPGAADMKGGLLVMLYALLAFEQSESRDALGWTVVLNTDEEVGSPSSRKLLEKMAKHCQLGLVFEPALDEKGTLAAARRGCATVLVTVKGKSAHAGRDIAQGRNAIVAIADIIRQLHIAKHPKDLHINIGKVSGGTAKNVVPAQAAVLIDVRYGDPESVAKFEAYLNQVVAQVASKYEVLINSDCQVGRPARAFIEQAQTLFLGLQEIAESLGQELSWTDSGGCCDGNNLATMGLCVIDNLGVCGGGIHTREEYALVESLVTRAQLSAALLLALADGELPWPQQ